MSELSQRLAGLSPAKRRLLEERLKKTPAVAEPIAVVGMGCRFPGAADLNAYWRLIREGIDATGEIPPSRWDVEALYDPTGEQAGKMSVKWAGLIDDVDQFDPMFFGISPREASRMDPQQRLLLEVAWEALENAGLAPERMCGTATGVFIGIGGTDYSKIPSQFEDYYCHIDAHVGTGNALSIAANRVSYIFDLHGPSVAIDTACSSGMMGVHLAVQSLRNRECDAALAGGVNLILSPETTIAFSKARMLSPDGCCRPFDAEANGYVRGEGCGILVLKRLTDALRDGDTVLAVIRASAANQDGRTSGITAPNGRSQEAVIRAAWAQAGLDAERVSYIEAHGTGTPLGDPIEIEALAHLFVRRRPDQLPCYVTSVKANIGHTETVSGIAGIIKVVLMMQHGTIPAQLHLQKLNPHISLDGTRLVIPDQPVAWQTGGKPRVAGVSSFGFGGTNTHVVLEEATAKTPEQPVADRPLHLLAFSAKTKTAVGKVAERYAGYLTDHPEARAADICFSANTGRSHFNHRVALVTADRGELAQTLGQIAAGAKVRGAKVGQVKLTQPPKVAFLFTGQGSQYVGMGRALYESHPLFRQTLDQCDEILRGLLDEPLLSVLYDESAGSLINQTQYTQPALFALEYALATLWRSWGIEPAVVLGHSVGEYVAACVAGVFSLEDGLKLIAHRARLMQQLPPGGRMAVAFAPVDQVEQLIGPYADRVAIAAENGPQNTTISGEAEAMDRVLAELEAAGISTQPLTVSHAFHSPLMDPMLDEFEQLAGQVQFQEPRIPIASNLTGQLLIGEVPDARYWRDHIRNRVRMAEGMQRLADENVNVMLEVGPTASMLGMGRRCQPQLPALWIPSLRKGQDDWKVLLGSLADLYVFGAQIDWRGFDRPWPRRRLMLPTYPFERSRYWFDQTSPAGRSIGGAARGPRLHPLLGSRVTSPLPTRLFEATVSSRSPAYLVDHQVQGSPVMPAAGYVELGLAAAAQLFGQGPHGLENVSIQQAMFLPEGASRVMQLTASPESGGRSAFETYSAAADSEQAEPHWTMHASGTLRHAETLQDESPSAIDLAQLEDHVIDEKSRDAFYQLMHARGLAYGPAFQVLGQLKRTDRQAWAEVQLADSVRRQLDKYHLHPALGDALFQTTACLVPLEPDGSYSPFTYMPTRVGRLRICGPLSERMYTFGERTSPGDEPSPETVDGNVYLLDEDGRVLVEMLDVRVQRVGRGPAGDEQTDVNQWLYRVKWAARPLAAEGGAGGDVVTAGQAAAASTGMWIIFADRTGVGRQLAEQLHAAGNRCVLVEPGTQFRSVPQENGSAQLYQIDPLDGDHLRQLLEAVVAEDARCAGVVHLWSLDIALPGEQGELDLDAARRLGCGSVLQLIRQLARQQLAAPPQLWLITRGAVPAGEDGHVVSPGQSALWGLGRVAAIEHPELRVRLVDGDPDAEAMAMANALREELVAGSDDGQVAWRAGRRLVAQLERAAELAEQAADQGPRRLPEGSPFQLRLGEAGSFDSLRYVPATRQPPEAGQVELQVEATGLNFSDVLKAMGLYPGITDKIVPLGIECAGTVTAVGAGVTRFREGDHVMGVAPYSFASHARTAEYALVRRPASIDPLGAATIPITFLTAYYALVRLAHLQPGERVLIHAGAGGVGLAAIQIAQHIGAEIFATAGSEEKRQFLRTLGVEHVANSRTLEFADQIMEITGREGIDVVLNSLPGEAITKSLSILRAYGRFLEIGKTDIYQNRMIGLLPFQDNLSYFAIDLDRMLRQRPEMIRQLFAEVIEHFEQGIYKPLPLTEFAADQTIEAFRYMAQRKNIGKVVVNMRKRQAGKAGEREPAELQIREDASYLITGGLGALGLQVARWLADQGARHLVLMSRRPPSEQAERQLTALRAQAVQVATVQADVTDAQSLAEALSQLPEDFPPLRGVVHAAGVLADGVLFDMDLDQLDRAMAPKVQGAWNLHTVTRNMPLDFFVLFSSVAAVLGSPGQANYAAGNAFLDALAAYRRRLGLPALSVNWGPWAGAGMAVEAGREAGIQSRGMGLIPPADGLQLLNRLLHSPAANAVVMDAHWPEMLSAMGNRRPSLLKQIAESEGQAAESEQGQGVDHAFRSTLLAADLPARQNMLEDYFVDELARIMGIEPSDLEVDRPLQELGMDSLLAMELKNNLERRLAFTIPMAAFMEGPSIASLAGHAARALADESAAEARPPETRWSPLVPLQGEGSEPPLFCVHPLGGDIRCYGDLARRLGSQRPVYALRGRGSDGVLPPHEQLDEMVAAYIEAIQQTCPDGPYLLAGWSAGGIFAYEIAQQLLRRRRHVGLLALIDTPLPSIYDNVDLEDDARFLYDLINFVNRFSGANMQVSYDQLRAMEPDERFRTGLREAQREGVVPKDVSEQYVRRLVETARAHVKMIMHYRLEPIALDVHLFRPVQQGTLTEVSGQQLTGDLGWSKIQGQRLIVHQTPGEHFSMMVGEDAAQLAELLNRCLAEALTPAGPTTQP